MFMAKRTGPNGPPARAARKAPKTETMTAVTNFNFDALNADNLLCNMSAILSQGALLSFTTSWDGSTVKAQILHDNLKYMDWFRKPELLEDWLDAMAVKITTTTTDNNNNKQER